MRRSHRTRYARNKAPPVRLNLFKFTQRRRIFLLMASCTAIELVFKYANDVDALIPEPTRDRRRLRAVRVRRMAGLKLPLIKHG